jgi:hypothetical protein
MTGQLRLAAHCLGVCGTHIGVHVNHYGGMRQHKDVHVGTSAHSTQELVADLLPDKQAITVIAITYSSASPAGSEASVRLPWHDSEGHAW